MKLARQYYLEKTPPEPQRSRFISRSQSYHGITLGALSVSGHVYRRQHFEPMLLPGASMVSPCFEYRGKRNGESDGLYVARLAAELDAEFQRVGPNTVCAFVAEPVVGAVSRENGGLSVPKRSRGLRIAGPGLCPASIWISCRHEGRLPQARGLAHTRRGHVRYGSHRDNTVCA